MWESSRFQGHSTRRQSRVLVPHRLGHKVQAYQLRLLRQLDSIPEFPHRPRALQPVKALGLLSEHFAREQLAYSPPQVVSDSPVLSSCHRPPRFLRAVVRVASPPGCLRSSRTPRAASEAVALQAASLPAIAAVKFTSGLASP